MPFYGYAKIPEPKGTPSITGGLISWLIPEGTFVKENTTIATVASDERRFNLVILFPARLEKFLIRDKEYIELSKNVLEWIADGESIPYGRDYFLLEPQEA
jgi:hypothetical protein